jgi:hypothetical protein
MVEEENVFAGDMIPSSSGFSLRFCPTLDHLRWRYSPGLPYIDYHLFRIIRASRSVGYVILGVRKDLTLVSQCDAERPEDAGWAVLHALAALEARGILRLPVMASATHEEVTRIYQNLGFRPSREQRPFWLGPATKVKDMCSNSSTWGINFDWGDNGLRPPFLKQTAGTRSFRAFAMRAGGQA